MATGGVGRGIVTPDPPSVYVIADWHALAPVPLADGVRRIVGAGISWIQVRAKNVPGGDLERQLDRVFSALGADEVELWMDDRADLAAVYPFAGVHVGQHDLPPAAAREVVGPACWIGLSTHDEAQVRDAADDAQVDVVAVGPVFATRGKEDPDPVVGLELVRWARQATSKPLVAIGGIDTDRAAMVLEAGADTVAVLGAICHRPLEAACRALLEAAR